ncbi:MAG: hypothetical protein M9962_11385 [Oligoflexia bacterium]|nr:hypothetical protein [Oligoflexia bacterium]
MKVLGLSFDYHDSSAALVVDGSVVAASLEERFSRLKHDANFPKQSIEFCLAKAKIDKDAIDVVAFYENPSKKFGRVLAAALASWPNSAKEFESSMSQWLGKKLWTKTRIASRLGIDPKKVITLDHHTVHAAQAFLSSGFQESAFLVVDAVGEWATTSIGRAYWKDNKPEFQFIRQSEYPNSLGLFYSAFTIFLGFEAMNSECSTMALAAFGKPQYVQKIKKVLLADGNDYKLNQNYLNFHRSLQLPFTKEFTEEFGSPFNGKYSFSSFEKKEASEEEQYYADIAASVQVIFEEAVINLAKEALKKSESKNLVYAGGGALNCVANEKIRKISELEKFYIPNEPGDGGSAVGAALLVSARSGLCSGTRDVYTGDEVEPLTFIDQIETKELKKFRKKGLTSDSPLSYSSKTLSDKDLYVEVAKACFEGKVVGWVQDKAEIGPRALGNRSILFRADRRDLALKVSKAIKDRALFRPYALVMNQNAANQILEESDSCELFEWMQLAIPVKEKMINEVSSGVHIDRTTRPQIAKQKSKIDKLLQEYEKMSGLGCLVNTSFNESGLPIVNSAEEALMQFARTDLDVLVVGNQVIVKEFRC